MMLRLMLKDISTQKKVAYFAPAVLLLYFLTMGKNITGSSFMTIMIYSSGIGFIAYFMVLYSNFETGESEKNQNRLLLSLPIRRGTVINAKYAMISAWWLITYISFVFILLVLNGIFHIDTHLFFDFRVLTLSLCFTYLLVSLFYPFHYKFGFRVASLIGFGLFFLLTSGLGKLLSLSSNSNIISVIMEEPIISFAVITFVFVLVSYFFSVRIFTKKDF